MLFSKNQTTDKTLPTKKGFQNRRFWRLFGDFFGGEKVTPPAGGDSRDPFRKRKKKWGRNRLPLRRGVRTETSSFLSLAKGKNRFQTSKERKAALPGTAVIRGGSAPWQRCFPPDDLPVRLRSALALWDDYAGLLL